jgi:hypothetical protein
VDSLSYTGLGQPLQYTMGTSGEPAYITDSYDAQTGDLARQDTQTGTAQASADDLNYSYNDVGSITSEADTPSGDAAATDACPSTSGRPVTPAQNRKQKPRPKTGITELVAQTRPPPESSRLTTNSLSVRAPVLSPAPATTPWAVAR